MHHYIPEIEDCYKLLANYYKNEKNYKKQLFYIEKLLQLDSLNQEYYVNINNTIKRDYEIPKLIEEKNRLINKVKQSRNNFKLYIFLLIGIVFMLIAISIWNYNIRTQYKKRFEELLSNEGNESYKKEPSQKIRRENLNISDDIIDHVLSNLEMFEKNKQFLRNDINLQDLSKEIVTNSNYLSRIINNFKQKTFTNYINDLRINEAVERLKKDNQFRKYTIQAIAHESGFKNSQSFSKAFYKKTGIYPSYFIKNYK